MTSRAAHRAAHLVIVVANLPVERDRRVIRQCLALERAGYRVTVVCPRGETNAVPGCGRRVAVRPYRLPVAGAGVVSFALEFGWSLVAVSWHLLALLVRGRCDAVQVCNPPDVFWPLALLCRALGRRFVFDHHDLSPEVYAARTATPNRHVLRVLRGFERLSLRCASAVISTNDSYRRIAIQRAGVPPERITVVRNGPAHSEVRAPAVPSDPYHRIVYLGVIGPQDGVAAAVLAAAELARRRGRDGWRLQIAGDGESLPDLRELVDAEGLGGLVEFTGWLDAAAVDRLLTGATLALQPDPRTAHTEHSTMAKTIEYLARGVPVVAVDLAETRASAGDAATYLPDGTPEQLAGAIDDLLDDPDARTRMSRAGRRRYRDTLAWDHQERAYLGMWRRLLGPKAAPAPQPTKSLADSSADAVQPSTP
ncbi:MAG: glycosyltransferase family 4 protein [Micromonosporaceae bacterium]